MVVPVAFAAARMAYRRPRLALSGRRNRHRRPARQSIGDHRGQIARRGRSGGKCAGVASAPAHRARGRSPLEVTTGSRRLRRAIRRYAGRTPAVAAPLARRLARRRLAQHRHPRSSLGQQHLVPAQYSVARNAPSKAIPRTLERSLKSSQDPQLEKRPIYPSIRRDICILGGDRCRVFALHCGPRSLSG